MLPKQAVHFKHLEGVMTRLIDDVSRQAASLEGHLAAYDADPSSGASKGQSSARVRLERLEKAKVKGWEG